MVSGFPIDQRGLIRGTLVDIGAFQTSLLVESTDGAINTTPAQLTLPGAVSLAKQFPGPIVIGFDANVFTGGQTIAVGGNLLELSNTAGTQRINGPAKGVTISGTGRVFQIDKGVTAYLTGLTINTTSPTLGAGVEDFGTAILTLCTFQGTKPTAGSAIEVSNGTITVSQNTITNWPVGIQVSGKSTATVTQSAITGCTTGIVVGSKSSDTSFLFANQNDLSSDTTGVFNAESQAVDATRNWWGSSFGPNFSGGSKTTGAVNFSPWLADTKSITLPTPDSLGFTSSATLSYTVTPDTKDTKNLKLVVAQVNSQASWNITPNGSALFLGNGGAVTVNGQSGNGFDTDVFVLTTTSGSPSSVSFGGNDAFNLANVFLSGNIATTVAAQGKTNSFDVSDWTGKAALSASASAASTILATKSFGETSSRSTITLTDTALTSTDGMNLTLKDIKTATLTVSATSVNPRVPTVTLDASGFSGVTNLTAGGLGKVILYGGNGNGSSLTATGAHDVLIGGSGTNTLTDTSTGFNILIGGGGPNTITGNGNDILISSVTDYDTNTSANITALDAFLDAWYSATPTAPGDYDGRVAKIQTGNGIPGGYKLNGTTVHWNKKGNTVINGPASPLNFLFVNQNGDSYTIQGTKQTATFIV